MSNFIKTQDHITVVFDDGDSATSYSTNPNYESILTEVRAENWKTVRQLMMPAVALRTQLDDRVESKRVRIENGVVYLDDHAMHNLLTNRMIAMMEDGFNIKPMMLFLENLMDNPSYRAVNELYGFLEQSDLPITEDGQFLAYKRINSNYKDIYSGKMDNSIGAIVEMQRNAVNEDKHQTCSSGLHFCSRSYLDLYGTGSDNKTVILKINPRDVVSIPSDYHNAKGRCCRYEVLRELEHGREEAIEAPYTPEHTPDLFDEELEPMCDDLFDFDEELDQVTEVNEPPVQQPPVPVTRKVLKLDLDSHVIVETFDSVDHAAQRTGIAKAMITRVLNGGRKSTGGYGWKWEPDQVQVNVNIVKTDPSLLKASILDDTVNADDYDEADEFSPYV